MSHYSNLYKHLIFPLVNHGESINEEKLKTMEKEATDALEMAKKENEERKAQKTAEQVTIKFI